MPELPEVETVARDLARKLTGLRIVGTDLRRPDFLRGHVDLLSKLTGYRVALVRRVGKQVWMDLRAVRQPALRLCFHLGMSGRITVESRRRAPAAHTHFCIRFARPAVELRFCDPRRFGGVWVVDPACGHESGTDRRGWCGRRLPPVAADPLRLRPGQLARLLQRRRAIKALLLDQEPISGMGNIYCDEVLFRTGIHPLTPAADLGPAKVRLLCRTMKQVLRAAIAAGGSSVRDYRRADASRGAYQQRHLVYGRTGRPCRRCGTPIQRLVVAGRGTHVCPVCQPSGQAGGPAV